MVEMDLEGGKSIVRKAMDETEKLDIDSLRDAAEVVPRLGSGREVGLRTEWNLASC